MAAGEIDDAQAPHPEQQALVGERPGVIGPSHPKSRPRRNLVFPLGFCLSVQVR
jgi:hypothetical protein